MGFRSGSLISSPSRAWTHLLLGEAGKGKDLAPLRAGQRLQVGQPADALALQPLDHLAVQVWQLQQRRRALHRALLRARVPARRQRHRLRKSAGVSFSRRQAAVFCAWRLAAGRRLPFEWPLHARWLPLQHGAARCSSAAAQAAATPSGKELCLTCSWHDRLRPQFGSLDLCRPCQVSRACRSNSRQQQAHIRRQQHGTWMRCCRNSAPPTAGASQPYPAGGRGIADSLTISAVSAGALVSTNVRVFCSPAGMSSRSRCAISSMLAATQDGFFCQKAFLSRSSGFLLRVRN